MNLVGRRRVLMLFALALLPSCGRRSQDISPSSATPAQQRTNPVPGPEENAGTGIGKGVLDQLVLPRSSRIRSQGYSEGYLVGVDGVLLRR